MPRAIFCLHALSLIMFKLGSAPKIQDLYGRVHFTDQEISIMQVYTIQGGPIKFANFSRLKKCMK